MLPIDKTNHLNTRSILWKTDDGLRPKLKFIKRACLPQEEDGPLAYLEEMKSSSL